MPLNGGANRGETLWKAARGWPAAHHGTGTSPGGRCGVVCICPASASGPLRVRVVTEARTIEALSRERARDGARSRSSI
jgi:hypothetical protein